MASTIHLRVHPSWMQYGRLFLVPSSASKTKTITTLHPVMTRGGPVRMTHQNTAAAARSRTPHASARLCRQHQHLQQGGIGEPSFSRTFGRATTTTTMFGATKRRRTTATDSSLTGITFAVSVQCPPRGEGLRRGGVCLHTHSIQPAPAVPLQQPQQHHYLQMQQQHRHQRYYQQQAGMFFMSQPSIATRRTEGGPGRRGVHQQMSTQQELDNVVSFYDDQITLYANQEIQTVTLKALLGFGRTKKDGAEAATASVVDVNVNIDRNDHHHQQDLEVNLQMARYARKELPVRLARRVKSIQNLPFIIGTNPYIKRVYRLYYDSFQALTAFQEDVRDKDDLDRFAEVLRGLVESHADVIPMLSQGFLECKKYMNTADIQTFLDEMIRSRIGIRLIAEQVIALRAQRTDLLRDDDNNERPIQDSNKYNNTKTTTSTADQLVIDSQVIGVVHTQLRPAELVKDCASFVQELCNVNYGSSPDVVINGQTDATFTYVPVHLEYILCELLKNSLRATVEHSVKIGRSVPRRATSFFDEPSEEEGSIARAEIREVPQGSKNRGSVNAKEKEGEEMDITKRPNEFGHPPVEVTIAQSEHEITIRIRDQGGGVSKEDLDHIFDYSFTTVKDENESSSSSSSFAAADGGLLDGDSPINESESIFKGVSRLAMQAGLGGPIAGLGFGLPLTRIYAQYFGGRMHLVSLQGHGVDVYLKLKQLEHVEDLQI